MEQIGHSNIAWTVDGYDISTVIKSMHNLIKFLIGHRVSSYKNSWCDEYDFGLEHISNPILLFALIC